MRTLITCALNDISIADLDERIYVEDIKEVPTTDQETMKRAPYGLFPLNNPERRDLSVTVTFMVKEKDRAERMAVIQKVRGWAYTGWLTTNMHPGQRLYVHCVKQPEADAFDFTARMDIEFVAYGEAYWQDITPVTAQSTSAVTTAAITITPKGTKDCYLEAEIAPSSGTLTSVTLTCGTQKIQLSGLSVTKAAPLKLYYDEWHLLHIESGGVSLMDKRSADSADDILLTAGTLNTVNLSFGRACTYTLSARGLWR